MLCRELIEILEKQYPSGYAMEWDNVGLLAGRDDKEVKRIYVAVDATDEVIEAAVSDHADLLITHHPMIFTGMKKINNQDFIGCRILRLIQNDISCYAMHTNYDILGMAELAQKKLGMKHAEVLEVTRIQEEGSEVKEQGIGKIADLAEPVTLREYCERVKKAFGLSSVRMFGNPDSRISRAAVCPGSGKSVIQEAIAKKAEVLVTGDIGHHEGIDAQAQGLAVIDAGHYGLEYIFMEDIKSYLKENARDVTVTTDPIRHPFVVV